MSTKPRAPQQPASPTDRIDVFDRCASILYSVPPSDVLHRPANGVRPILCAKFSIGDPTACPYTKGGKCRYAHVDLNRATSKRIHVNYALKTPADCQYKCMAGGTDVMVREPDSVEGRLLDVVPAECVIETNCLFTHGPAIRCAHFYFGRECHLGAQCDFAHVIHLSETANPWEKAPTPSTFGRGKTGRSADAEYYGENQYLIARNEAPPPAMPIFTDERAPAGKRRHHGADEDADVPEIEIPAERSLGGDSILAMLGGTNSPRTSGFGAIAPQGLPVDDSSTDATPRAAAALPEAATAFLPQLTPAGPTTMYLPPGTILLKPPAGFEFLGVCPPC